MLLKTADLELRRFGNDGATSLKLYSSGISGQWINLALNCSFNKQYVLIVGTDLIWCIDFSL